VCCLGRTKLPNRKSFLSPIHTFVVRIWWEEGLTQPDGRPLWRGQVQHAPSGQTVVFQSLDKLMSFIRNCSGQ